MLAKPAAAEPGACHDDDAAMQKVVGFNCAAVAKQNLCAVGTKSCTCSCPAQPAACHDDDGAMNSVVGLACKQVVVRHMCAVGRKSCQCSCPAAAFTHRHLFGVVNNACPIGSFDAKLKSI